MSCIKCRAHYFANVEMIDTQVGRIMDALERRGTLENSIIIFTSDHGDNLGDHGLSQKWAPYEEVNPSTFDYFSTKQI